MRELYPAHFVHRTACTEPSYLTLVPLPPPCPRVNPRPDGNTLAALMHHGALADAWQSHLTDFFQGSREHVHPGETAGNTQLLAKPTGAQAGPVKSLSATIEVRPMGCMSARASLVGSAMCPFSGDHGRLL